MSEIQAFENRLRKNAKHFGKWARRQGLSCYRIYDRDIPEYPVAVDIYTNRVHLQVYKRNKLEWNEAALDELSGVVLQVTGVEQNALSIKLRQRQEGISQYEKTGLESDDFVVEENGLKFWVNLDKYLDTGLFLDHRLTRQLVLEKAKGKNFLNLFAYTGSFSVYAAEGGAASTTTIDLSNTYQAWTKRNFELNGLTGDQYRLVCDDVLAWLNTAVKKRKRYGLIVLDPPSFSNSKKMRAILDVQRDHKKMIEQCVALLSEQGELIFSNNYKKFKLDPELEQFALIKDITHQTVPEDFKRHRPHQCWLIRKR